MDTRYRVRIKGHTVGVSVYADGWAVEMGNPKDDNPPIVAQTDYIAFYDADGDYVAVFSVELVEKILTGPTADDVVWTNPVQE